jgi:hypothetical protein
VWVITPRHYGTNHYEEHHRVCEGQEERDRDLLLPVAFSRGRSGFLTDTLRQRRFHRRQGVLAIRFGQLGTPSPAVRVEQGFVPELGYIAVMMMTLLRLRGRK